MNETALREAFALFSEETKRLSESYASLKEEFQRIQASGATLEQIVENLSEGVLFVGIDETITHFNEAASSLTGFSSEDVLGRPFGEIFSDSLFGFSVRGALVSGKAPKRVRLTLSEGNREVEVSSSVIPRQGILLLLRDVTETFQLEQAVSQGNRLKELGEMGAGLAHEIRNPLGGIEGFAALLHRDLEGQPEKQRMTRAILDGARTLNHLVTSVLDHARPFTVSFSQVDLPTLLQETITLVNPALKGTCTLKPSKIEPISADPALLKRAFLNLIQNGVEMADHVMIELAQDEKETTLTFTDDGPGIAPENLPKLFIPFFTTKADGTGLGLSETHKLIEAHGGTIEVSSNSGTTFTVRLPCR